MTCLYRLQESQLQKRLDQLSYTNGYLDYEAPGADTATDLPETLQDTLQRACQTFQDAETVCGRISFCQLT